MLCTVGTGVGVSVGVGSIVGVSVGVGCSVGVSVGVAVSVGSSPMPRSKGRSAVTRTRRFSPS
ncbi:hypothetical protein EG834_11385 [bacterium]|nr:hypothetical protein [bacterium]